MDDLNGGGEPKHRLLRAPQTDLPFPGLVALHVVPAPKARFRSPSLVSVGASIPVALQGQAPWVVQYKIVPPGCARAARAARAQSGGAGPARGCCGCGAIRRRASRSCTR